MAARALLLALLLVALPIAGCIEVRPEDIELRTDEPVDVPPSPRHTEAAPVPHFFDHDVSVLDLRADPSSPHEPLRVAVIVTPRAPAPFDLTFHVAASWGQETWSHEREITQGNNTSFTLLLPEITSPGRHEIGIGTGWQGANLASPKGGGDIYPFVVYDSATLVLDANRSWYQGQNTFYEELVVPYAPWLEESGLDLLERAAERFGFTVETRYREDLDSYYVTAVNGTAERWEDITKKAWSYSWMVHQDGALTNTAIDDTYLEPGHTLGLRYLKCYTATAHCEA